MNYLQIFADKEALLEPFDDAERGRLLTAMLAYALHDELIELTGNERYIWPVFRQMIDQSRDESSTRGKPAYNAWRKEVLERDCYACAICGSIEMLEAHHIKPYALFPHLRIDHDNGITLCSACHKAVHRGDKQCPTAS